jgi:hypothetical protein
MATETVKAIVRKASKQPNITKPETPVSKKAPTAAVAKPTAEQKKESAALNELIYRVTSVIVPIWFGHDSVDKIFKKRSQIPSESAICLIVIGARGTNGCSVVGIAMNLRPSGFDRSEAQLLAHMGCMSLLGAKMAKWVKKPVTEEDYRLFNLVLTAKGQKVFDLAKKSILAPVGKPSYFI